VLASRQQSATSQRVEQMSASPSDRYEYGTLFFNYIEEGALRSARTIVPIVVQALGTRTILDVGCGAGAWLLEYERLGVAGLGIDGDYVQPDQLLIPAESFVPLDVTRPFDLERRFDLVQCLEVAEHIPTSASATLVENLTRHSDRVLFSAAVPGQGGEHHINEQPHEYWRGLFAARGYVAFDFFRPRITGSRVEPWYAHNVLLYARETLAGELPSEVRAARVPSGSRIPDVSSVGLRLRRQLLRRLPTAMVTRLAVWKHRFKTRRAVRQG